MNWGLGRVLALLDEALAARAAGDESTAELLLAKLTGIARSEMPGTVDGQTAGGEHSRPHRPEQDRRDDSATIGRPSRLVVTTEDCYEYDDNT